MKKIILFVALTMFVLSGCASTSFEKMESCIECAQGLQEFESMQHLIPAIK